MVSICPAIDIVELNFGSTLHAIHIQDVGFENAHITVLLKKYTFKVTWKYVVYMIILLFIIIEECELFTICFLVVEYLADSITCIVLEEVMALWF